MSWRGVRVELAAHAEYQDHGDDERRRVDRDATLALSDGLVRLFANRFTPLRALRSLGLVALERIPGLVDELVTGAMGFRGDVPALSRGIDSGAGAVSR